MEELRDRLRSLERRLDEAEASRRRADDIIEQLIQASSSPSVTRGAIAEGANELARRLVPVLIGGFVFVPSALGAVISYFNNAETLAVLTAFFGTLVGLVGTFLGVRASSQAREVAQRIAAEAQDEDERAAKEESQKPSESPGDEDEPHSATGEAQEGVQRPWWRRMFGG